MFNYIVGNSDYRHILCIFCFVPMLLFFFVLFCFLADPGVGAPGINFFHFQANFGKKCVQIKVVGAAPPLLYFLTQSSQKPWIRY